MSGDLDSFGTGREVPQLARTTRMVHEASRLIAGALAALAALVLAPMLAGAQEPRNDPDCTTQVEGATPEQILAALEAAANGTSAESVENDFRRAGLQAQMVLGQFSGCRQDPEDFGARSGEELDAFANRLVDLAIAHPENERYAWNTGILFLSSADMDDPRYIPYAGAYDALERLYAAHLAELFVLASVDLERTMRFGVKEIQAGRMAADDLCYYLGYVVQFGKLILFEDGSLEVEVAESADHNEDTPPRPWGFDQHIADLADELVAEGVIPANCGGHRAIIMLDGVVISPPAPSSPYLERRR